MSRARRRYLHVSLGFLLIAVTASLTLAGCVTVNPPSDEGPKSEPPPATQPTLQPPGQDYTELQWTLENRTANLSTEAKKGVTHKISFAFDKPVDVWFEGIDDVILSIAGSSPKYPPHSTSVQDASGRPMYYFMGNVTSFSYSVTGAGNRSIAPYVLHVRPSREGDVVTVTQRVYEQ